METYQFNNLSITLDKQGSREFSKVSYPIRYGRFSEIKTPDYVFQFNLNGEIKYIQGRSQSWPHPVEWLKRTVANDWVYYSTGGYTSVYDSFGEYYIPCRELLEFVAESAYKYFEFERSNLKGAWLFLFGSAESIINSEEALFESLNSLPFYTYINIGLESADPITLTVLKKPITVRMINEAFSRMLEINRKYEKVEVTANFIFGNNLPGSHLNSFFELNRSRLNCFYSKGAIYFSPLINGMAKDGGSNGTRGILRKFYKIKVLSHLPTFIYLIQRL